MGAQVQPGFFGLIGHTHCEDQARELCKNHGGDDGEHSDDYDGSGGLLDLNMLVMTGGRERTMADFERLLSEAGFRLWSVIPTGTVNSLICAEAL